MQQEQNDLLQALYEEYQGIFRFMAFKNGLPECEVDDIIQDTFFSFMRYYGKKSLKWNESQIKGALMKIFENRCIDYFRRLTRKGETSIDAEDPIMEYHILQYQMRHDICDTLILREELQKIRECIMAMRPKLSQVAVLYMIEGRSVEEVCEILDISSPTCRMRISRIRKHLKKELIKTGQFP